MEEEKKVEETKVETPKKKSGIAKLFYWLIVIGGCVFIFLGSYKIGYKLGNYFGDKKSNNTTTKKANKESNSNTASSETLTVDEALTTGRDLYTKAIASYPSPLSGALDKKCTIIDQNNDIYDCTTLYNEVKELYTENNDILKNFTLNNGKYTIKAGGIGFGGKITTTLSVKSLETDKIVFNAAVELYNEPDKSTTNYNYDFAIAKENNEWKISSYKYVLGDNPTTSVVK